jgi:hypothetical protein
MLPVIPITMVSPSSLSLLTLLIASEGCTCCDYSASIYTLLFKHTFITLAWIAIIIS